MKRRDPLVQTLVTCVVLVALGLLAITLGKRIVARTEDVYDQLPALVSGGLGGIALVIIGCMFAYVQVSRVCAEQERLQQAAVLAEVAGLTDVRKRLALKRTAIVDVPAASRPAVEETVQIPVVKPDRVRRQRPVRPTTGATESRPVRRPRAPRVAA